MAVYKRGKVWYYDFTLNEIRHNKSTQARNKRDAETIERKVRNDLVLGIYGVMAPRECPVFKEYAEGRFLAHIRVRSADKPRTVKYYEEKVRRLLEFDKLSNARLSEIDADLIEQYVQFRAKKKRHPNRELAALRHSLKLAEEWKLIHRAPKIRMLPGEKSRDFVLSYELEKLYLATAPQPLSDAAVLMLDTGMRTEECVTREWADVFLTPAPDAKYGYVRIDGKTGKRNVPLTERSRLILERRREFHPDARFVFPGRRKGKPLTVWALDNFHAKVRRDTIRRDDGQPAFPAEFVVYSLRHTFGTRLGESGAPPFTIMTLMGHASITTSQKYSHPTPEHIERAMARKEAMDALLRGEVKTVPAVSPTGKNPVDVSD